MWCLMPAVPPLYNTTPMGQDSLSLAYGFQMDGVLSLNNLTALSVEDYRTIEVFPNPTFSPFGNGQKLHQKKNELFVVEVSSKMLFERLLTQHCRDLSI